MFNPVEQIYRRQSGSNYLTLAKTGKVLVNKCIGRLNRLLGERVRLVMRCDASRLSRFCSNGDPVPVLQGPGVVCGLSCSGCSQQ